MSHSFCSILLLSLFLPGPAIAGRAEYVLGGESGNSWLAPLQETAGFYQVFGTAGQIAENLPVGTSPEWVGADTLVDLNSLSLAPVFIDPLWNLTHVVGWDQNGQTQVPFYDVGNIRVTQGEHGAFMGMTLPSVLLAYDGDPTTSSFRIFNQRIGAPPGVGRGYRNTMITNFGSEIPINRIRFFPRLSKTEDAHIIAAMAEPKPDPDSFGEESFAANYLEWYEIGVADNTAPIADDVFAIPKGQRWHKVLAAQGIGGYRVANDEAYTIMRSVRENLDIVVDYRFPRRHVRWVAIRALDPIRDWEIAEVQIFGEGYGRRAVYITDILDFGREMNWGKIRWSGQTPPGTSIEIRTRTGDDFNPNIYWQPNRVTGEPDVISYDEHFQLPVQDREIPFYDTEYWSYWSPPYDFVRGQRDPSVPASAWEDGMPLQSPSPSRYLQLQVILKSTEDTAPQLDALWIQMAQTFSAAQLVGEIWPIAVDDFEFHTFTYVVQPDFVSGDTGFDRLEILTHTRVSTVHEVRIGGVPIDLEEFVPEIQADRLIVPLDRKLQSPQTDRFKLVEVDFDVVVLRFGTEFQGWVFNSDDPDRIKQQVKAGNATFKFSGDVLAVVTRVGGDLLVEPTALPNPFSPNGDGINDQLQLSVKVREVVAWRGLQGEIYDLNGRLCRSLVNNIVKSGALSMTWDGRDNQDQFVAPGLYLYRIRLETDSGSEEKVGVIAVAY